MFLTRMGTGSKMVVTGDGTQIDLPIGKNSGLLEVQRILSGVKGIHFITFEPKDVVRHRLVQHIVEAYSAHDLQLKKSSTMKLLIRVSVKPTPVVDLWIETLASLTIRAVNGAAFEKKTELSVVLTDDKEVKN